MPLALFESEEDQERLRPGASAAVEEITRRIAARHGLELTP
jgi:hypothetical protein